jgi:hypothetical protein
MPTSINDFCGYAPWKIVTDKPANYGVATENVFLRPFVTVLDSGAGTSLLSKPMVVNGQA